MEMNTFFSELFLFIIAVISLVVAHELYITKNGILRKLMIATFLIEGLSAITIGVYLYTYKIGLPLIFIFILISKALVKLRILYYLSYKN